MKVTSCQCNYLRRIFRITCTPTRHRVKNASRRSYRQKCFHRTTQVRKWYTTYMNVSVKLRLKNMVKSLNSRDYFCARDLVIACMQPHLACRTWPAALGLPHLACRTWPAALGLPHLACRTWPAALGLPASRQAKCGARR